MGLFCECNEFHGADFESVADLLQRVTSCLDKLLDIDVNKLLVMDAGLFEIGIDLMSVWSSDFNLDVIIAFLQYGAFFAHKKYV